MQWDTEELRASSAADPEEAWMRTISLVPEGPLPLPKRKGSAHPAAHLAEKARRFLLDKGFNEVLLPVLVDEKDVYLQAGTEAPLVLDRSYYAAALPKPQPTEADVQKLRAIAPSFNDTKAKALHKLVESFSAGELTSAQLLERMVSRLGIRMEQATKLLAAIAPSIQQLQPHATNRVFRDSLTTAWFESLSAVIRREPLPSLLFTIGMDHSRDGPSLTASFVMVDENACLETGEETLSAMLNSLGIRHTTKKKKATSHQFTPGTETLLLSAIPLGSFGMLSPVALSNYDISVPVFCASVSLSAAAVSLGRAENERAALYPQFYGNWSLPDTTIAALVKVGESPVTPWGRELSRKLVRTAELYSSHRAPCEFKVFERELGDHRIAVWLVSESGTLCRESVLDEVLVHDGNIVSVPPTGRGANPVVLAARRSGVRTGIRLLDSFADMVASRVERDPSTSRHFSVTEARAPADVNISVPGIVEDYINSKSKSLGINATLDINAELRVKRLWVHEQPR